jgi:hypothetical protein
MSKLGNRLRKLATEIDNIDTKDVLSLGVILCGDKECQLSSVLSGDDERDIMMLGLGLYQATNMKAEVEE